MSDRAQALSLTSGLLAAVGASLCCAGPLVVLMLGIGGSWVSGLTAMEPYQPIFIVIVALAFGWSGWQLHRPVEVCEPGTACADPKLSRRRKIIFWGSAIVALILTSSAYWIPWFIT